jgi:uncharacterized protein
MTSTSSGPTSPVMTALRRFYAAEERYVASGGSDFAAVAAVIHPDIVVWSAGSLPYGGEWRGAEQFERFLEAFSAAWEELEVQDPKFVEVDDDAVIVLLTMKAKARKTGERLHAPLCQINRFRDGLLAEVRPFYWDTAETNRILGHR